jgi:hypothetical protein
MSIIYIITWRHSDGSGSGAVGAFFTKTEADQMLAILRQFGDRDFAIEAVPCGPLP